VQKESEVRSDSEAGLPLLTGEGVGKRCDVLFSEMGRGFEPPFYVSSCLSSSR